ncbi:unnamed protein product [Danaus chrysippus]|uniref:(African queen) hypothetical protein n=1 Tax=Danaus chrysippus TaxID=151541 RepID=A0A8J2VX12_9NEOP|nr:unnamed protein product [Danaus chrysippus]
MGEVEVEGGGRGLLWRRQEAAGGTCKGGLETAGRRTRAAVRLSYQRLPPAARRAPPRVCGSLAVTIVPSPIAYYSPRDEGRLGRGRGEIGREAIGRERPQLLKRVSAEPSRYPCANSAPHWKTSKGLILIPDKHITSP